ncbi:MAG: hypothetical protein J3K34DRAFT_84448 [Monoraphidium minutum]|nr:MAG: hypothetical protein J3K34DRAFT_84448 [Monoraphidium minutum]
MKDAGEEDEAEAQGTGSWARGDEQRALLGDSSAGDSAGAGGGPARAAGAAAVHLQQQQQQLPQQQQQPAVGGLEARLASWAAAGGDCGAGSDLGALARQQGPPAAACNALFASHALARWAWRTWEFAVALILVDLHPGSLGLISAYGLVDNLVRVVGGAPIGAFVDRTERLAGATAMYMLQNACILVSAVAAAALLWLAGGSTKGTADDVMRAVGPHAYWPLMAVAIAAGAASSVGSMGAAAAVEREWVKALCGGDSLLLARVNSVMRAIDMLCLMLSPMAAGFLMTYAGMLPAVLVIAGYAMAVWLPECLLLRAAHRLAPQLREPKPPPPKPRRAAPLAALCAGWPVYLRQPTLLPAAALALLYLTCLSLGFLMTAFLRFHGLSEASLSVFRGLAAASGLLSTAVFPRLHRAAGLAAAGAAGFAWLNACLLAGALPIVAASFLGTPISPGAAGGNGGGGGGGGGGNGGGGMGLGSAGGNGTDVDGIPSGEAAVGGGAAGGGGGGGFAVLASSPLLVLLMCGLAASRLGVWLADLAVSQMQQELVPSEEIGAVNGVQSSVQSVFEIMSFVAGAILRAPQQFHWLMLGSCASISAAGALYARYAAGAICGRRAGGGSGGSGDGGALGAPPRQYVQLGQAGGGGGDAAGAEEGAAEEGGRSGP